MTEEKKKEENKQEENKKTELKLPCLLRNDVESYDFYTKSKAKISLLFPRSLSLEELKDSFAFLENLVKKTIEDIKKKEKEDLEKDKPASENTKKDEKFKPVK